MLLQRHGGVTKVLFSGTVLGKPAEEGDSPVSECDNGRTDPEYRGTREILWEAGGTTPQA